MVHIYYNFHVTQLFQSSLYKSTLLLILLFTLLNLIISDPFFVPQRTLRAHIPKDAKAYLNSITDPIQHQLVSNLYQNIDQIPTINATFSPFTRHQGKYIDITLTGFPTPLTMFSLYNQNKANNYNDDDGGGGGAGDNDDNGNQDKHSNDLDELLNHEVLSELSFYGGKLQYNNSFRPNYKQDSHHLTGYDHLLLHFHVEFTLGGIKPHKQFEIGHSWTCNDKKIKQNNLDQYHNNTTSTTIDTTISTHSTFFNSKDYFTSLYNKHRCPIDPPRELRALTRTQNDVPASAEFDFAFHPLALEQRELILMFDIQTQDESKKDGIFFSSNNNNNNNNNNNSNENTNDYTHHDLPINPYVNSTLHFSPIIRSFSPPIEWIPVETFPYEHNIEDSLVNNDVTIKLDQINFQELCEQKFKIILNSTRIPLITGNIIEIYSHFRTYNIKIRDDDDDSGDWNDIELSNSNNNNNNNNNNTAHYSTPNRPIFDHSCQISHWKKGEKPTHIEVEAFLRMRNTTQVNDQNLWGKRYQYNQEVKKEEEEEEQDDESWKIPKALVLNLTSVEINIPIDSRLSIQCNDFHFQSPNAHWNWSQFWVIKVTNLTNEQNHLINPVVNNHHQQQEHSTFSSSSSSSLLLSIEPSILHNNNDNSRINVHHHHINQYDHINHNGAVYATYYVGGIDRSDYIPPFMYLLVLGCVVAAIILFFSAIAFCCQRCCRYCCKAKNIYGLDEYNYYESIQR